jgi:hypothetical protein
MNFPKKGMHFEDVRKRVKRIEKTAPQSEGKDKLVNSLLNQAKLHEGEGAVKELTREVYPDVGVKSRSNFRMGMCLKTCQCPECRRKKNGMQEKETKEEKVKEATNVV